MPVLHFWFSLVFSITSICNIPSSILITSGSFKIHAVPISGSQLDKILLEWLAYLSSKTMRFLPLT